MIIPEEPVDKPPRTFSRPTTRACVAVRLGPVTRDRGELKTRRLRLLASSFRQAIISKAKTWLGLANTQYCQTGVFDKSFKLHASWERIGAVCSTAILYDCAHLLAMEVLSLALDRLALNTSGLRGLGPVSAKRSVQGGASYADLYTISQTIFSNKNTLLC